MKLTRFESQEIKETMDQLVIDSGAMSALLITKEGFNLQEAGNTGFLNTTALAALIAGMFTATKEVARMVGEAQFSILLQQGENRHIHISLIDESNMMVIIFEDYQKIGRVRLESRRSCARIQELMTDRKEEANASPSDSPKFKEYALNLIDRIFDK